MIKIRQKLEETRGVLISTNISEISTAELTDDGLPAYDVLLSMHSQIIHIITNPAVSKHVKIETKNMNLGAGRLVCLSALLLFARVLGRGLRRQRYQQ